jgi:hypothetical protein
VLACRRGDGEIRPSVFHDVCEVAGKMREADRMEVWASSHHEPEEALLIGYRTSSVCRTALWRGEPVAMFGLVPETLLGGRAVVWLLGTDGVQRMGHCFARLSRWAIREMLQVYPLLFNYVDARYKASVDWLRWCGADVREPEPHGLDRLPFHFFTLERRV